ncbi:MAG TPA: hypothetical protein VIM84_14780, partial [Gemmatimonadales bacterium]
STGWQSCLHAWAGHRGRAGNFSPCGDEVSEGREGWMAFRLAKESRKALALPAAWTGLVEQARDGPRGDLRVSRSRKMLEDGVLE